jgi:HEPN domain-containing protein
MESHKQWLSKAESDLRASENLVTDELVWDVAIYHTQQCAEKALKSFLAWSKYPLEKTHNLVKLLELCIMNLSQQNFGRFSLRYFFRLIVQR